MAVAMSFDSKTIDQLQELGKLNGQEKFVVSVNEEDTRKISLDTIVGYAAAILSGNAGTMPLMGSNYGGSIIYIKEGESIDISQRSPGWFYLEERTQTSVRAQINLPTSVKVSSNLGLRRV